MYGARVSRRYSPVEHLARSIYLGRDWRELSMAMFTAYFDASGHPDALGKMPAFYVSGFVAQVTKWTDLEDAWQALLAEYQIPSPFHMAQFMTRKGRFASWQGNDTERDAFRMNAARLMKRTTNKPFAIGVVIPDLHRMFAEYEVPDTQPREPYPWCALRACEYLFQWAYNRIKSGKVKGTEEMRVVFEHGDEDQGMFAKALWKKHRREVDFQTNHGKKFAPFAACDFLAWEFRNYMSRRERGMLLLQKAKLYVVPETRVQATLKAMALMKANPVILEITKQLPDDALTYANWDVLVRMCALNGWPRKS